MKKVIVKSVLIAVAGIGLLVGNAQALLIDFTDSNVFGGINGTSNNFSTNFYGFDVTLTGSGNLSFNGGVGEAPGPVFFAPNGPTLEGDGDGIGIIGGANYDEIDQGESLTVSFMPSMGVTGLYFLDLFQENGTVEFATYDMSTGNWGLASGNTTLNPGAIGIIFTPQVNGVASIRFTPSSLFSGSDFALAGIEVNPVPEPTTMLLFGAGLAGLAAVGRRRKN